MATLVRSVCAQPDHIAVVRLVGALLAGPHEERMVASRPSLSAESLKAARAFVIEDKEVLPELVAAS
jgi:hypothetical protein